MTDTQNSLLLDLYSVGQRLNEVWPGHPHMPGLFRRYDGIIKDLYRTGMNRDEIDWALDDISESMHRLENQ